MCKHCQYTFHENCIRQHLSNTYKCPLCKKVMVVNELAPNILYRKHLEKLEKQLEEIVNSRPHKNPFCAVHAKESEAFCVTCNEAACIHCYMEGVHKNQCKVKLFENAYKEKKQEIEKTILFIIDIFIENGFGRNLLNKYIPECSIR